MPHRRMVHPIIASLLCLATLLWAGCRQSATDDRDDSRTMRSTGASPDLSEMGLTADQQTFVSRVLPQVKQFCADCHVMPRPASSAKDEWPVEIDQGFMLYAESGRSDLMVPNRDEVLKFFQLQAPETLRQPVDAGPCSPPNFVLQSESVFFGSSQVPAARAPAVTNMQWIDLDMKGAPSLVYCDIGSGAVKAHWPSVKGQPTQRLATVLQPVRVEPCDLNQNGRTDLLVADIGQFDADDVQLGSVVWLRRKADEDAFEKIVLADGLSRLADVQTGDFDGDGDIDILVAAFGWRKSGRILMLENIAEQSIEAVTDRSTLPAISPSFKARTIDPRPGAVRVVPVDLNHDGHLDFVALIAQEHEVIEAFINDGAGNFASTVIYQAPDPAYCSNGIELVDLDGDGDLDILYSNGDSFDRGVKPYHSLQWLENEGNLSFKHHHLCEMPGAQSPKVGDFDGDGRLDIVTASLIAGAYPGRFDSLQMPSVVLLMQTKPRQFERRQVESGAYYHIAVETGDFNNNGRTDFAVGTFLREKGEGQPDLKIWWNRED